MKKKKTIWKIVRKTSGVFSLVIFFFLFLIIIKSANWFLSNFGGVDFSTVVYQLFSPMKGTSSELLNDYCRECLYPSISFSLIFLVLYSMFDLLLARLVLGFDICIWKKRLHVRIGNRCRLISKSILLGLGFLIVCVSLWNKAVLLGIPEYINSITNSSRLYETEYVDPNGVALVFPEQKRNLLLIYLESMETTYASVEEGGGKPADYIPRLTELAKENLFFSDDIDLGGAASSPKTGWTMAGLLASSSGVNYQLPIEGNSAGEYEKFLPGLTTIGDILEDAGYQNYFMCGSDAVFAGRFDFYNQHGNYHILDYNSAMADGIIPEGYYVFWGMEDQYLYEYAKQKLTEIAGNGEPFNFTMLTVDTHHTDGYLCELCGDEYVEQYANVIACADQQICQFIDWVKEQDWYENTTIVITGDHTSMKADFWDDIGGYNRRIYNCFIHLPEDLQAAQTSNRSFTMMDMFPTILAAIDVDIEDERLGLGTNLFSDEQTLSERIGREELNEELKLYSKYYYSHFIIANQF